MRRTVYDTFRKTPREFYYKLGEFGVWGIEGRFGISLLAVDAASDGYRVDTGL
ncbi:hypothetical protein ACFVUS_16095 [Nocardia sp. NPDC058058]|uniref:hypothetical protein n=1 Tax=Nocardia sp. NPDC058058 TaxID=3346317 RepID=UPI0036DC35C1